MTVSDILDRNKGKLSLEYTARCARCTNSQPLATDNEDEAKGRASYMLWRFVDGAWICPNCAA